MAAMSGFDPEYREFIELFNRGEYDAAHRALTPVWAQNMSDTFYKGLIQLAGAYEHWEEGSLFWAEDLFASAHNLLSEHGPTCEGLCMSTLLEKIRTCNEMIRQVRMGERNKEETPLPRIKLDISVS